MKRSDRVRVLGEIIPRLGGRPWFDVEIVLREYGLLRYTWAHDQFAPSQEQYLGEMLAEASDETLLEILELVGGQPPQQSIPQETQRRVWGEAPGFRLFLSHVSQRRAYVQQVAEHLNWRGISTFVAHVDIEPSREWANEIAAALNTCEALVAFLHDGFRESAWADQECGVLLGRGLLVIPVKFGSDPHGFLGHYQAIIGDDDPSTIAERVLDVLVTNERTQEAMAPQLVRLFEVSSSFADARKWMSYLERLPILPWELLQRIEEAVSENGQVSASWGVPERVTALLRRHGYQPEVSVPAHDDFGEEPF